MPPCFFHLKNLKVLTSHTMDLRVGLRMEVFFYLFITRIATKQVYSIVFFLTIFPDITLCPML
ncbi:hypothetical protein LOK49_Contig200G00007 [Camellia lanceoleosa]|nr:hypothetical protein LOK49_Contig200G00007 [Camellia lanceoleosa]